MKHQNQTTKLVYMGVLLALGLILPFFTGQVPKVGNMLLPMHLPVLVCGFICGGPAGLIVGFVLPVLRSFLFGMPKLVPVALAMSFELGCYGLVSGLLYKKLARKVISTYVSLVGAMICGRVVWGVASYMINKIIGNHFTWQLFVAGAFTNAIPGIIIQIIIVPILVVALNRTKESAIR